MILHFKAVGAGFPLVVLHGVFGSGDNWISMAKIFGESFEVFLVDQRNHGKSPHDASFSYDLLVEDLKSFLETNGLSKINLLGHSMGGKVAMRFAQKYPELLEKLIVVDISPRFYKPHHDDVLAGFRAVQLETLTSRMEAETQMAAVVKEADVRQFLLKNLYRNEDGKFAWRVNLDVLERNIHDIGAELPAGEKITIPTLFVSGGNSRYIQDHDVALIHSHFSNVSLSRIEGAGHWIHAEKPAEFSKVVLDFLQGE